VGAEEPPAGLLKPPDACDQRPIRVLSELPEQRCSDPPSPPRGMHRTGEKQSGRVPRAVHERGDADDLRAFVGEQRPALLGMNGRDLARTGSPAFAASRSASTA
jgi:hypothetical protein